MVATWPYRARRVATAVASRPPLAWPLLARRLPVATAAARPPLAWPLLARRIASAPAAPRPPAGLVPNLLAYLGSAVPGLPFRHGKVAQKRGMPAAVLTIVDGDTRTNLSGSSGQAWADVQVAVYSGDPGDCWSFDELVRLSLQDYSGPMGGLVVDHVQAHPRRSDYQPRGSGDDRGAHSALREYRVIYAEPKPARR